MAKNFRIPRKLKKKLKKKICPKNYKFVGGIDYYKTEFNSGGVYLLSKKVGASEIPCLKSSNHKKDKEERLSKGLTQMELAYRINKDHPSINKLENGKVNPSFIFLSEVAEGLEVNIKDFLF